MDEQRLVAILDAYGGDPARWPADEREAALGLLGRSSRLQALREEALRLDASLDDWGLSPPSADLVGAVLPQPASAGPKGLSGLIERAGIWLARPLAAMSVAGAIALSGVMTGYAIPQTSSQNTTTSLLASEVGELILPSTQWTVP